MKKNILLFLLVFCVACNNDLDLVEEFKDIPIVYGLISTVDTAQYIRVEKAFIDESTSAFDLALDPNNLYYDNAQVAMVRESTGERYMFERVNGEDEGFVREEGVFAQSPNFLFKKRTSEMILEPEERYKLEIVTGSSGEEVITATTVLSKPPIITTPGTTSSLDFFGISKAKVKWFGNPTVAIYDLVFHVNYLEKDNSLANASFEEKTKVWNVAQGLENPVTDFSILAEVEGTAFFTFMASELEANDKFERVFKSIDVIVFAGGVEIKEYQNVGLANLGITSSQDIPTYTNLSSGRGLFSSRTKNSRLDVNITPRTLDSLKNSSLTKDLGF